MQNAEFKMQNAECRMQNVKCRIQNAELVFHFPFSAFRSFGLLFAGISRKI